MRGSTTLDRWLGGGVALVVLIALVVIGCEQGPTRVGVGASPTAPVAAAGTVPALANLTPGPAVARACQRSGGAPLHLGPVQVGTYDSWQALPGDLPLSPQTIAVAKPLANIALRTITVAIPVLAAAPGTIGDICAVSARITAYASLAAPIPNVTRACSDHPYLDPGGADYGGDCGPGPGPAATAAIAFSATAPGTTISEPVTNAAAVGMPAVFPPVGNGTSAVWIALSVPVSGTYTVTIGLWQSLVGPSLRLAVTDQWDVDAAHEWSGQACTLPTMQAHLPPPANPPLSLLCPGAPPLS